MSECECNQLNSLASQSDDDDDHLFETSVNLDTRNTITEPTVTSWPIFIASA